MKYATVAKRDKKSQDMEEYICEQLKQHDWEYDEKHPSLVICVGGDGTLLFGVHKYIDDLDHINFIGIHTGTLGFFTDYTASEVDQCIADLLSNKEPEIYESKLLEFKLDNEAVSHYALNEIRIENIIKSQEINVFIDGEFFETCKGSGVCLSTQAGSTAYNRSLKGAVIDSGISLLELTEITPIYHSVHRSLGVPYIMMESRVITLQSRSFDTAMLCFDHRHMPLDETHEVVCRMSEKKVKFARYRSYSYLKRLKNLY